MGLKDDDLGLLDYKLLEDRNIVLLYNRYYNIY